MSEAESGGAFGWSNIKCDDPDLKRLFKVVGQICMSTGVNTYLGYETAVTIKDAAYNLEWVLRTIDKNGSISKLEKLWEEALRE